MRVFLLILAAAPLYFATSVAAEPNQRRTASPSAFMRVYGPSLPPYGFVQFCERNPQECSGPRGEDQRFVATPARMAELDGVNRAINAAIAPATDLEVFGVAEHWTIPIDRGDCEDYALLKRQVLISLGWPASALLLTVVRDDKGEGHAVLTARTSHGDFILDNKVSDVKIWHKTGYAFVMRQSYLNQMTWMSLDPTDAVMPQAIAGVQRAPRQ